MSQIRLESADELEIFLKILAEESISAARDEIMNVDSDPALKTYSKSSQADSISQLKPVREEVDEEEQAEVTPPAEEPDANSEDEESVSLDTILDGIKQLRSGKSVDDGTVKPQIRTYYDRLNVAEREALATFVKAFAGFVTGEVEGPEAQDPSDPPLNIQISKKEKEQQAPAQEKTQNQTRSSEPEEEPEDTSPPIKVGQQQQIAEIRERIKKLMTRE